MFFNFWFLKSIVPGQLLNIKKNKKKINFISTLDIEGLNPMPGKLGVIKDQITKHN